MNSTLPAALWDTALALGKSVAFLRKPGQTNCTLLAGQAAITGIDAAYANAESGFYTHAFNHTGQGYFISPDILYELNPFTHQHTLLAETLAGEALRESLQAYKEKFTAGSFKLGTNTHDNHHYQYRQLVSKAIKFINEGNAEKIVTSRKTGFAYTGMLNLPTLFLNLCRLYPMAFVSLWHIPGKGTWLGATPELLACINAQGRFNTVALAGTKPANEASATWGSKEIHEQELVSAYIRRAFDAVDIKHYGERGPYTYKAGNVCHLKSDFETMLYPGLDNDKYASLVNYLHPTPAVCGTPRDAGYNFLQNNEGYNREFYAGYLGAININDETALFVNLRCMKVEPGCLYLFAGGGITASSNPEKEWEETELKMQTLLAALR